MRIAIHTQHFAGVGHHMRATRLARALRRATCAHEVLVFDGGRPIAGAGQDGTPGVVPLPPLVKGRTGIETLQRDLPLSAVLAKRRQQLVAGLRRFSPDALVLDSFPFSRWPLREEIFAAIEQVRASNPAVRVVCSVRDVPRASQERYGSHPRGWDSQRGRPWPIDPGDDALELLPEVLNRHFDAILVHGDPRVTRLEDHFPWVPRLDVPVHYTGYVRQEDVAASVPEFAGGRPLIVVSCGGGVNGLRLIELAAAAFGALRRQTSMANARMVVFAGAFMSDADLASAAAACNQHGAQLKPFAPDFTAWLNVADLSISRGGYNTVVALLAARVRALVFPGAEVADQAFRTERLAEFGTIGTRAEAGLDAPTLAGMIGAALGERPPAHDFDLGGAERTVSILGDLPSRSLKATAGARSVLA